jgi:AmpD protein
MKRTILQTPNISKTQIKPIGVVWHHTAGAFNGSVDWCMNPISKVSYHGIVDLDGSYTQLALDHHRVWANGISSFKGRGNCNDFLISLAVSGDTNNRDLTKKEIETMAIITIEKMQKFNFAMDMITTHRAISPTRKNDISAIAEKQIVDKIKELLK